MKQCKSCRKDIDDLATKCPHCQAYQNWFRNPQYIGFIFVIPFIGFMLWQTSSFKSKSFDEYRSQFAVEEVRVVISDDGKYDVITYTVQNNTDFTWKRISYEVRGYDSSDTIVIANSGLDYSWSVKPNSKAYLSVRVTRHASIARWEMHLVNMETSRY